MVTLKILSNSKMRWFSNVHPYYRWKKQLWDQGIKVELFFDHTDKRLRNSDNLLLHSRYFSSWRDMKSMEEGNHDKIISYLTDIKKDTGKLIWYDETDSTGVADFPIIPYVDVFAKKQVLKNKDYYTEQDGNKDLRIWLNKDKPHKNIVLFKPCPKDQLHKIKPSWSIAVTDYRYFPKRFNKLSNFLSYKLYSPMVTNVDKHREYDLIFRGSIKYDEENIISYQRNKVLTLLQNMPLKVVTGGRVTKLEYLKEFAKTKVSVSPFGFGELCWRDFETFNSGSLLIKPSMEHLITYPNVFIPFETYIPVSWELNDLQEKLEDAVANYNTYKQIAKNGQENFVKTINDPNFFINRVKAILE